MAVKYTVDGVLTLNWANESGKRPIAEYVALGGSGDVELPVAVKGTLGNLFWIANVGTGSIRLLGGLITVSSLLPNSIIVLQLDSIAVSGWRVASNTPRSSYNFRAISQIAGQGLTVSPTQRLTYRLDVQYVDQSIDILDYVAGKCYIFNSGTTVTLSTPQESSVGRASQFKNASTGSVTILAKEVNTFLDFNVEFDPSDNQADVSFSTLVLGPGDSCSLTYAGIYPAPFAQPKHFFYVGYQYTQSSNLMQDGLILLPAPLPNVVPTPVVTGTSPSYIETWVNQNGGGIFAGVVNSGSNNISTYSWNGLSFTPYGTPMATGTNPGVMTKYTIALGGNPLLSVANRDAKTFSTYRWTGTALEQLGTAVETSTFTPSSLTSFKSNDSTFMCVGSDAYVLLTYQWSGTTFLPTAIPSSETSMPAAALSSHTDEGGTFIHSIGKAAASLDSYIWKSSTLDSVGTAAVATGVGTLLTSSIGGVDYLLALSATSSTLTTYRSTGSTLIELGAIPTATNPVDASSYTTFTGNWLSVACPDNDLIANYKWSGGAYVAQTNTACVGQPSGVTGYAIGESSFVSAICKSTNEMKTFRHLPAAFDESRSTKVLTNGGKILASTEYNGYIYSISGSGSYGSVGQGAYNLITQSFTTSVLSSGHSFRLFSGAATIKTSAGRIYSVLVFGDVYHMTGTPNTTNTLVEVYELVSGSWVNIPGPSGASTLIQNYVVGSGSNCVALMEANGSVFVGMCCRHFTNGVFVDNSLYIQELTGTSGKPLSFFQSVLLDQRTSSEISNVQSYVRDIYPSFGMANNFEPAAIWYGVYTVSFNGSKFNPVTSSLYGLPLTDVTFYDYRYTPSLSGVYALDNSLLTASWDGSKYAASVLFGTTFNAGQITSMSNSEGVMYLVVGQVATSPGPLHLYTVGANGAITASGVTAYTLPQVSMDTVTLQGLSIIVSVDSSSNQKILPFNAGLNLEPFQTNQTGTNPVGIVKFRIPATSGEYLSVISGGSNLINTYELTSSGVALKFNTQTDTGPLAITTFTIGDDTFLAVTASSNVLRVFKWTNNAWVTFGSVLATGASPRYIRYVKDGGTNYLAVSNYDSKNISVYLFAGSSFILSSTTTATATSPTGLASYYSLSDLTTYLYNGVSPASINISKTGGSQLVPFGSRVFTRGDSPVDLKVYKISDTWYASLINQHSNNLCTFKWVNGAFTPLDVPVVTGATPTTLLQYEVGGVPSISVVNSGDNTYTTYRWTGVKYVLSGTRETLPVAPVHPFAIASFQNNDNRTFVSITNPTANSFTSYRDDLTSVQVLSSDITDSDSLSFTDQDQVIPSVGTFTYYIKNPKPRVYFLKCSAKSPFAFVTISFGAGGKNQNITINNESGTVVIFVGSDGIIRTLSGSFNMQTVRL